jgi:outer membrane protein OmpA-like peptidoglycan-associated protein
MKKQTFGVLFLSGALLFSSCNMNSTGKGSLIGAGGGAALGALIGKFAGNTGIGAAIGGAVGAGAGALIGHKMDKAKAEAEKVANAKVESVKDANGLDAVKVTFDSGILFTTGSSSLSNVASTSLSKFAKTVLLQNTDMDVAIQGYTDNQGWKGCTTEQSQQKNTDLSLQRAQSVENYLRSCGVTSSQIKSTQGFGESNPVASNDTQSGKQQNRRVEVYLYASQAMINQAQQQAASN